MQTYFYLSLCLLYLLPCTRVRALCPQNLDVVLASQDAVEDYTARYPHCPTLNSLVIGRQRGSNISDISGLTGLIRVTTTFVIEGTRLTRLTGLDNFQNAGELVIRNNRSLASLTGLGTSFSHLFDLLVITNNPVLSDCAVSIVCEPLREIPGDVIIYGNKGDCATYDRAAARCPVSRYSDRPYLSEVCREPDHRP